MRQRTSPPEEHPRRMKKIIIAALLGGFILFVWSFIAHLPPVGTAGLRVLPPAQNDAIAAALGGAMKERALYILPGSDMVKFMRGPAAIVAFNPRPAELAIGGSPFATFLILEVICDILAALCGAIIAINLSPALGFWPRVFVLMTIGVLATIDIDASYWNWYAFPTRHLLAQFVDHAGGWFFAGLVLSKITKA
jgi:uncharacterized membrane protein